NFPKKEREIVAPYRLQLENTDNQKLLAAFVLTTLCTEYTHTPQPNPSIHPSSTPRAAVSSPSPSASASPSASQSTSAATAATPAASHAAIAAAALARERAQMMLLHSLIGVGKTANNHLTAN